MTLPEAPAPVLTLLKNARREQLVDDEDAPPQSHRPAAHACPAELSWLFALRRDARMRETAVAWVARSEW